MKFSAANAEEFRDRSKARLLPARYLHGRREMQTIPRPPAGNNLEPDNALEMTHSGRRADERRQVARESDSECNRNLCVD